MIWTAAAISLVACGGLEPELESGVDHESITRHEQAPRAAGNGNGQVARFMTRNLYIGAEAALVLGATDLPSLVSGAGAALRQVTATSFPVRVKGLAAEILETKPDLVGLQEVALWRTGPPSIAPLLGAPRTAAIVRYDFLALLLAELNFGRSGTGRS